jgi:hypothetical protein
MKGRTSVLSIGAEGGEEAGNVSISSQWGIVLLVLFHSMEDFQYDYIRIIRIT